MNKNFINGFLKTSSDKKEDMSTTKKVLIGAGLLGGAVGAGHLASKGLNKALLKIKGLNKKAVDISHVAKAARNRVRSVGTLAEKINTLKPGYLGSVEKSLKQGVTLSEMMPNGSGKQYLKNLVRGAQEKWPKKK